MVWHKINMPSAEGISEIIVAGKKICFVRKNENIHACTKRCPHAGADLTSGFLDAMGNIVCPLHHYRFSLKNGRNTSGEGYFLKTFPLEEREDGLYIGLPEENL